MKKQYSSLEIVVSIVVLLITARFIWAEEVRSIENQLFELIGFGGGYKYFILIPLGCFVIYRIYKREAHKVQGKDGKVIGIPVIVFSVLTLVMVTLYLVFWVAGTNA